jgi:hypothetical protein
LPFAFLHLKSVYLAPLPIYWLEYLLFAVPFF